MSLFLFDLDDTLIKGYMQSPDKNYDRVELLPGRRKKLQDLHAQGHRLGMVTNQGGVAFGYVTAQQAHVKMLATIDMIGVPMSRFYCFSDQRGKEPWNDPIDAARRKPSGAMIKEAISAFGFQDTWVPVWMVGDRQEDRDAAKDARVGFVWARDFFAEGNPAMKLSESLTNDMFKALSSAGSDSPPMTLVRSNRLLVENPDSDIPALAAIIIDTDTGITYSWGGDLLLVGKIGGKHFTKYDGEAAERLWQYLATRSTKI